MNDNTDDFFRKPALSKQPMQPRVKKQPERHPVEGMSLEEKSTKDAINDKQRTPSWKPLNSIVDMRAPEGYKIRYMRNDPHYLRLRRNQGWEDYASVVREADATVSMGNNFLGQDKGDGSYGDLVPMLLRDEYYEQWQSHISSKNERQRSMILKDDLQERTGQAPDSRIKPTIRID